MLEDLNLSAIDAAISGAKDRWDHADAPHNPDMLALIRAAEAMRTAISGYATALRDAVAEAEEHAETKTSPEPRFADGYAMGLRVAAGVYGLPEGYDPATRSKLLAAGVDLTDKQVELLIHMKNHDGQAAVRRSDPDRHAAAMTLVGKGLLVHTSDLSAVDVFDLTDWGRTIATERTV